jgi:hypothetical protein
MKAIVVEHAGAPDVLQIRTLPRPQRCLRDRGIPQASRFHAFSALSALGLSKQRQRPTLLSGKPLLP